MYSLEIQKQVIILNSFTIYIYRLFSFAEGFRNVHTINHKKAEKPAYLDH